MDDGGQLPVRHFYEALTGRAASLLWDPNNNKHGVSLFHQKQAQYRHNRWWAVCPAASKTHCSPTSQPAGEDAKKDVAFVILASCVIFRLCVFTIEFGSNMFAFYYR
jgi:hypothetical protein